MKPTCVYRLFVLLGWILFAVMLGTTASTDEPSPAFGLLFGGLFILIGVHWVRHKHEVAQAQIFHPRAINTPGYVGFMGMLAILMGALVVIGWAVAALQQACRCF